METVLQVSDQYSAMLSLEHETFLQMALLIPNIYSVCSFVDAMFSSGNFRETFFCSVSFAHAQSTSKSKSAYFFLAWATRPKVASESSGTKVSATLGENRKGSVRSCFMNDRIQTFEKLSVLLECPFDFDDFPEQIR